MSNLTMGLFNNFEATLYETVDYINNIGADVADYQTFQLVPHDKNKWPLSTQTYFTNNPCYLYMTLYNEATGFSAVYKMFFDDTMVATTDVATVKGVLAEQPAFDRDIPALTQWPVGTSVSNTASKQAVSEYGNKAIADYAALAVTVADNTSKIGDNKTAIQTNAQAVSDVESDVASNTLTIASHTTSIEELGRDVATNKAAIQVFTDKTTTIPGADKIPLADGGGTIDPAWIEGFSSTTITDLEDAIADVESTFSTTMAPNKAPLALGDGTFDESWKMGGGSGSGMPLGAIIPIMCTDSYAPVGLVATDGATYTDAQFPDIADLIAANKLPRKTMSEFATMLADEGKVPFFGWDGVTRSFRVPYISDGTFIQQAMSDAELGKAYDAGLPDVSWSFDIASYMSSSPLVRGTSGVTVSNGTIYDAGVEYGTGKTFKNVSFTPPDPYGNSTTVQPSAIALRHFVVVATETDQQSVMDWSAWATGLAGKANTDLSNFAMTDASAIQYKCIYGTGQAPVGDKYAIEDDTLGTAVVRNSRYVLENPFGVNTQVLCKCEVFAEGAWITTGYITSNNLAYQLFTNAASKNGEGIIVTTGNEGVVRLGYQTSGGTMSTTSSTQLHSAPCRVHVWKIGV